MAESVERRIRGMILDAFPGVWEFYGITAKPYTEFVVPHGLGRVPDFHEIVDITVLQMFFEAMGGIVPIPGVGVPAVLWRGWSLEGRDLDDIPDELRPEGGPTTWVHDVNAREVIIRNVFKYPMAEQPDESYRKFALVVGVRQGVIVPTGQQGILASLGVGVEFVGAPNPVAAGNPMTFRDLLHYTQNAWPIEWTWDFGDGTPAVVVDVPSATHTYAAPGTFTVTLTVKIRNPERADVLGDFTVTATDYVTVTP